MAVNGTSAASIEQEAHHISNGHVKVNNWDAAGPAAFDFRSMWLLIMDESVELTQPRRCHDHAYDTHAECHCVYNVDGRCLPTGPAYQ